MVVEFLSSAKSPPLKTQKNITIIADSPIRRWRVGFLFADTTILDAGVLRRGGPAPLASGKRDPFRCALRVGGWLRPGPQHFSVLGCKTFHH
ncbi:MAG: hypothetical protein M3Q40_00190 [Pseudomonadota bacterium]|nr:hypothetical protein [Pseudomonadota bacterium]